MYNFSKRVNRKNSTAYKWFNSNDETISMTIADMEFEVAPVIVDAVKERLEHPVFGYDDLGDAYYDAIISWYKKKDNITLEKKWIQYTVGVIPAIRSCILELTEESDNILLQSPVYPSFYKCIKETGRNIIESELVYNKGSYTIDFADLEEKLAKAKLLILCSPHNPIGRIWTKEELEKIIDLCNKHDVILLSDEIHSDLVYKNEKHTMMLEYFDKIDNLIVCVAPTKTFNLAGIKTSSVIIKNKELRAKVTRRIDEDKTNFNNTFAAPVTIAAYNKAGLWLEEVLQYLEENRDFIKDYFAKNLPEITLTHTQATYLQWIDCSSFVKDTTEFCKYLEKNYNLKLQAGKAFGTGGESFIRLNYACSREVLEEALARFVEAAAEYSSK